MQCSLSGQTENFENGENPSVGGTVPRLRIAPTTGGSGRPDKRAREGVTGGLLHPPGSVRLARKFVLAVLLSVCVEELGIKGVLRPITVESGSMIPTLWGPEWTVSCPGCGWPLKFDAASEELRATLFRAVCPHCGKRLAREFRQVDELARRVRMHRGRRVLIVRGLLRAPRRWDVVAVRERSLAGLMLKRVVGLPGETTAVENGVLCVGTETLPRPWPVQRQMARLIERVPRSGEPSPILAADPKDGPSTWVFRRPVTDYCFHHPAMDQRERPSANLLLHTRLETVEPESELLLRAAVGEGELMLQGQTTARGGLHWQIRCRQIGGAKETLRVWETANPSACRMALSLVDGRWLVMIDDHCVLDLPRVTDEFPEDVPVFELTVKKGRICFRELAVFHVAPYQDGPVACGWGYALLGDDPHASLDSRQGRRLWRSEDIVGIVWPLPW